MTSSLSHGPQQLFQNFTTHFTFSSFRHNRNYGSQREIPLLPAIPMGQKVSLPLPPSWSSLHFCEGVFTLHSPGYSALPFLVFQLPDFPASSTLISPLPFIHLGYKHFQIKLSFYFLSLILPQPFFPSLLNQLLYYDFYFSPPIHYSNHFDFSSASRNFLQLLTLRQLRTSLSNPVHTIGLATASFSELFLTY